jgi:hypothetical protein
VQVCDPLMSEVAAEAGNDFIWIEMEHSHMSRADVMAHIMACLGASSRAEAVLFDPGTIYELKFVCSQRGLCHCRSSCPDSSR